MKTWKLMEAQQCLGEVVRRAESSGPQRVTGPDGDAFVLSALDYERLATGISFADEEEASGGEEMSFLEFMRTSPLAEAMAAGEISPEEWDRVCRIGR
jgi:hypothetical protein